MQEVDYNQVISEIRTMDLSTQLRLLEEMAAMIRKKTSSGARSILELGGKDKEIWQGLGIETYIDEERSSWNG